MVKQIEEMDKLMAVYNSIDSINKARIAQVEIEIQDKQKSIDELNSKLAVRKKRSRRWISALSSLLILSTGWLIMK